jgi:transposase-like protein
MTLKRKHRTESERTSLLEQWEQSGQSARAFAMSEGLNASSLYLWRKQLKAAVIRPRRDVSGKPAFSELRLTRPAAQSGHIDVVARNGRIVRIHGDVDVRVLQQVLAAVEQC